MALEERIQFLEVNHPTFLWERKLQLIYMLMREFVSGLEYSIILPSAWPYLKSMDVHTWFYGLTISMAPVGTIITLPLMGWLYDKDKKTRQLYTILNVVGFLGFLIYSLPFSPWLPFCGRILIGLHSADNPMFQGEISWTYRSQDRLRAFAIVLIGFFVGIVIGPLFSFTFEHINLHSGNFYLDYRNLPSISLALAFLMLEVLNRFMIVNLAKNCVDENGTLSGKEESKNCEENVICENKCTDSSSDHNAHIMYFDKMMDVKISSDHEQSQQKNQIANSITSQVIDVNIALQSVLPESRPEGIRSDFDSEKLESALEAGRDLSEEDVKNINADYNDVQMIVTQNVDVDVFSTTTSEGYSDPTLSNKCTKKSPCPDSLPEHVTMDHEIPVSAIAIDVVKFDDTNSKADSKEGAIDSSVRNREEKEQPSDSNLCTEPKERSKVLTILKELSYFEIMGVIMIAFIMWLFIAEGEALLPIVTQDHFDWSVLETNYLYISAATIVIIVYITLSCIGDKISDTRHLCIILPIGGIAPIFLILYSLEEEGEMIGMVFFFTGIFLGVITEPFANAVTKALLSKVTPLEIQGSMGSLLTMAGRCGNLGGPLYATLMLEYMIPCNIFSTSLFVIGLLWLLVSLKRLNCRRQKYAVQIKA